jgi:hypothetical protein
MRRYDVCRKDTSNPEKARWVRVGVVFLNDQEGEKDGGSLRLDLFAEKFYLFPPKEPTR